MDTQSNAPRIIAICVSTVVMATSFIALRLFTRFFIIKYVGWDDWLMLAAGFFSIGASTATAIRTKYGLGHHVWTVPLSDFEPDMKILYAIVILYNIGQILVKTSILSLYLRIFILPANNKICRIVLGIVVIYGVSILGSAFFQCTPISYFWDKNISGHCISVPVIFYTTAALNILTDIGIFTLPLPIIAGLTLPLGQRIGVVSIFVIGFFVCIVSVIRVKGLEIALKTTDPTWDSEASATWTIIELNAGIICGCLPTLKPLAAKFVSRFSPPGKDYFDMGSLSNSHIRQTSFHAGAIQTENSPVQRGAEP